MSDDNPQATPDPRPSVRMTAEYKPPERHHVEANPTGKRLAILALGALGVVYGDIGTSPLYALREVFSEKYGITPTPEHVLGVLSLVFWALVLVITVKYIVFILRADNRGEGGILAMLALILQKEPGKRSNRFLVIAIGLMGAALLYGDGMITPAISVLSAMEGLTVVSDAFEPAVVPLSAVILVGLFVAQKFGTARVGAFFGPITLLWFAVLAILGTLSLLKHPGVLAAVNPLYALRFFQDVGAAGFFIMGAVVLVVTGGEALYADMGHFGKRPIRVAWLTIALPALLLNYFGQGALLLTDPTAIENPFFLLAPRALLYPMVALATMATVIASQAMISGAFSITQQCIQLGYSPRMTITHTSAKEFGQIYIPEINSALAVGCLLMVFGFRSSEALGAAYGIAVTGTFVLSTILYSIIALRRWHWPLWKVLAFLLVFGVIDVVLFSASASKFIHGGWVPVVVAIAIFTMMTTWKRGRLILTERMQDISLPMETFLADIGDHPKTRVPGTAVFMTSEIQGTPVVLLHHLKHNKVLHETVILMSIRTADVPETQRHERVSIEALGHGFFRVIGTYGFMEGPDVKEILQRCRDAGIAARPLDTSYYLGREQLIPRSGPWKKGAMSMNIFRKKLFAVMSRNARSATQYFQLPPNRVVELGTQIEF
ncbi:potassium transporter Kup [Pseudogemmatithrix spongiicola]|uniref:Probable potassium transport system protein Kup n=2 Tax=Pseudogemmatithrix spongiicola TaxID=3062599 RepID=A0AA49Q3P1_9BACT|nr:potassium transporter Kup [Gemmatimonadaceae bacterium 'strain 138']WKW13991.1 potassium transporter Kup [Gemmatimonadaceae bacterium 'strain 318']